ncbi:nitrate regulatory protein [Salinicola socius]|uniref:ANTAR domain-containing protein n=1 Tax=Salinicola socius TaxID=404433 RepID=A0A1Q8STG2_9GAMM|nr:hypothetical protein BTW07_07855 [Salinicola socius]
MHTVTRNAAERLLCAAKSSEIEQLSRLAETCAVVGDISRFVHALQRERGSSCIYLASGGDRFAGQRQKRIQDCLDAEESLRQRLENWTQPEAKQDNRYVADARLLHRVAAVWHGFDALPSIRDDIGVQRVSADDAMRLFNRLISNLLSVIFEAADTASDADVTRALVCLFHFIQGKELAGQERACGAFGFTLGEFDAAHRDSMRQLIDAQRRCLDTFVEFASIDTLTRWQEELERPVHADILRLRELACQNATLPADLESPGEQWYAIATLRIDAMQGLEERLIEELHATCRDKIATAKREARDSTGLLANLHSELWSATPSLLLDSSENPVASQLEGITANAMDSRFSRSLIDLVQTQSARLQSISDELESTRKTLRERKLIERAKGLLMTHQKLSEEQAYRLLRKTAMDQSKPLASVAQSVIDLADMLSRHDV